MNWDFYIKQLPFDIELDDLVIISASLSVFLSIVMAWLPFIMKTPNGQRIKTLKSRRSDLLKSATEAKRRGLKDKGVGFAGMLAVRMKLRKGAVADAAQEKLLKAGFRSRDAVMIFLLLKVGLPSVFGVTALILFYGVGLYDLPPLGCMFVSILAVLLGAYAPDIYVKNKATRRQALLQKALPDALDLMVICTESGLNLDGALLRTGREMRLASPELADELELTSIELGFLSERREALENFGKRTGLSSVEALVSTLAQAEKYGTPMASSLKVLASEMRDERLMKAEEKAAKLPATLTIPMVIFIMPALFIVLIGPGILRAMDAFGKL